MRLYYTQEIKIYRKETDQFFDSFKAISIVLLNRYRNQNQIKTHL